jgi:hypothetical protein
MFGCRSTRASKAVLLPLALFLACGVSDPRGDLPPPDEKPWVSGKADGFDWSGDGQGTFTITTEANTKHTLGDIAAGTKDVTVKVTATCDVDLQLVDADDTLVVHWQSGVVKGETASSASYGGLTVAWSGYGGIDGEPGNEELTITGTTATAMTVKLYAIGACDVVVDYAWDAAGAYKPFSQRLQDFAAQHPQKVVIATKQGKPAIFLDTSSLSGDSAIKSFYGDLYKVLGTNTLMAWNPAGENFFHLWTPDSDKLEQRFQHRAMTVYGSPSYWDASTGNLDDEYGDDEYCEEGCSENCYEDVYDECADEYEDEIWDCPAYETCVEDCVSGCGSTTAERAVALIVLSDDQMVLLNTYLAAITDDPSTNLGPSSYNGGVPPYFTGDPNGKHNCTSWFSEWIHRKVSSEFAVYYNPAALMKSWTTGGWSGQLATRFRGLLVFNHPTPPASGATISKSFPLDFGH